MQESLTQESLTQERGAGSNPGDNPWHKIVPQFIDGEQGSRIALYRVESTLRDSAPPIVLTHGTFSNGEIFIRTYKSLWCISGK